MPAKLYPWPAPPVWYPLHCRPPVKVRWKCSPVACQAVRQAVAWAWVLGRLASEWWPALEPPRFDASEPQPERRPCYEPAWNRHGWRASGYPQPLGRSPGVSPRGLWKPGQGSRSARYPWRVRRRFAGRRRPGTSRGQQCLVRRSTDDHHAWAHSFRGFGGPGGPTADKERLRVS